MEKVLKSVKYKAPSMLVPLIIFIGIGLFASLAFSPWAGIMIVLSYVAGHLYGYGVATNNCDTRCAQVAGGEVKHG